MEKEKRDDLLSLLNGRVRLAEKFRKPWLKEVKKWELDYLIETIAAKHVVDLDNQIQIPYIFSTIESSLPMIFERMPNILMKQRGKDDRDFTEFAEKIWDYLRDRLMLEERVEEAGLNFLVTGMAAGKYGWEAEYVEVEEPREMPITNSDGTPVLDEAGEPVTQETVEKVPVAVKNLPYFHVFTHKHLLFSIESKFVLDDEDGDIPYIVCVRTLTADEVEADYGTKPPEEDAGPMDMKDFDMDSENIEKENDAVKDDLKRYTVYEYYGRLPKSAMTDEEKKDWKVSNTYYAVFTMHKMLKKPEQMVKKPFLLLGNYGLPSKFWRFGEPRVLRELEQDVSLGRSRIMDIRDRQGTKIAIPSGTEVDEGALKKSKDFTIMRFAGNQLPTYVSPPPIPEAIMTALEQSRQDIQMASATLDLARGGTSSTVDTATGQRIFQEATTRRNDRKRKKIAEFISGIAKNLLILCGNNWSVEEFAKITDMAPEEIQQAGFIEKLQTLGEEYDVEIDIETITDNKEAKSAQAIAFYRETQKDPFVNHEEVLKETLKTGFGIKDPDRFLSGQVTPEQIMTVLAALVEQGVLPKELAEMIVMSYREANPPEGAQGAGGDVGRPATNTPTDIVEGSTPNTNETATQAQVQGAAKQVGVPKGPQGV